MKNLQRLEVLSKRSALLRAAREFFYRLDFDEVQTPTLSADTMVDSSIDPIRIKLSGVDQDYFLQTSPEFAMKRLLLEGMERIFEITPAFRNAESGALHNLEFTMLEWYRVGDSYDEGIQLLIDFAQHFFPERIVANLTYEEIFQKRFGINPHIVQPEKLNSLTSRFKIPVPDGSLDRDTLLQILMSEKIEPDLGQDTICIVRDWPESQSALARRRPTELGYLVAERFELYINGVELANGYHELGDPAEQLRRLKQNNEARLSSGLAELPLDSRLLEEMKETRLPGSCGVAVGFDRLAMVKLGLEKISDVLAFDFRNA